MWVGGGGREVCGVEVGVDIQWYVRKGGVGEDIVSRVLTKIPVRRSCSGCTGGWDVRTFAGVFRSQIRELKGCVA